MCNDAKKSDTPKQSNIGLTAEYLDKVDNFKDAYPLPTRTDAVKRLIDLGLEWYKVQQDALHEALKNGLPIKPRS